MMIGEGGRVLIGEVCVERAIGDIVGHEDVGEGVFVLVRGVKGERLDRSKGELFGDSGIGIANSGTSKLQLAEVGF